MNPLMIILLRPCLKIAKAPFGWELIMVVLTYGMSLT